MEKTMINVIKKYWKLFIGAIISIFSVGVVLTHKEDIIKSITNDTNQHKEKNIVDEQIQKNEKTIEKSIQVVEKVVKEKEAVQQKINTKKQHVDTLNKAKKRVPKKDRTLSEAKANIIKKTERK